MTIDVLINHQKEQVYALWGRVLFCKNDIFLTLFLPALGGISPYMTTAGRNRVKQ